MSAQEPLAFPQSLHWYTRDQARQWKAAVLAIDDRVADVETFRLFTYVLEALLVERGPVLSPFTSHEQVDMRRQVLYALGKAALMVEAVDLFLAWGMLRAE